MVLFKANKILIERDTIAEQIFEARQEKKLKIAEIAKRLNIGERYLEAIEKGDFNKLPQGIYGKKYISEYASFLGLDAPVIMEIFEREVFKKEQSQKKKMFSMQVVRNSHLMSTPKILRNIIIALVVIVCLFYLGYRMQRIISLPVLTLISPAENLVTVDKEIEVSGYAEVEAQILVNGELTLSGANGYFSKKINLKEGVNTITVTVKKKYGRENTIERQVKLKENGAL